MHAATISALADPAFLACLQSAASNRDLVAEFDRLVGTNLSLRGTGLDLVIDSASGRLDADLGQFVDFVRDTVYERLDPELLLALRAEKI